jgi:hypothetical protein
VPLWVIEKFFELKVLRTLLNVHDVDILIPVLERHKARQDGEKKQAGSAQQRMNKSRKSMIYLQKPMSNRRAYKSV